MGYRDSENLVLFADAAHRASCHARKSATGCGAEPRLTERPGLLKPRRGKGGPLSGHTGDMELTALRAPWLVVLKPGLLVLFACLSLDGGMLIASGRSSPPGS
jgi:hypothetical protein